MFFVCLCLSFIFGTTALYLDPIWVLLLAVLWDNFRMGLLFKFGWVVPEIFHVFYLKKGFSFFQFFIMVTWILVLQKMGFFKTRLRGNLHIWNGTKKKTLDYLFCNFLGINTHKFVKNDPKFENKCLFHQGSTNCVHGDERVWNIHAKRLSHAWNYVHLNQ